MEQAERLKAEWEGPLRIPQLPTKKCSELEGPGVYLYCLEYPSKMVVYAGKSDNLLWRIQQHYGSFLGFIYPARDGKGDIKLKINGYERFESLNDVDKKIKAAIQEVKRLKVWYWPLKDETKVKRIKAIESTLICKLKSLDEEDGNGIVCDNLRREPFGKNNPPIIITNYFDKCKERRLLRRLLGDKLEGSQS